MHTSSRIYVAGHTGLVGSALIRLLHDKGFTNVITCSHSDLDLTKQSAVDAFFKKEKPDYVFLAAGKVGGIYANKTYPADFIYQNLMIAANVIHSAYTHGVKKLLNLGSSCIYPKHALQPMTEDALLSSALEPTNEAYAIAKIAAIKLCRYYNEQYGTNYLSVMPTNLYGVNDNYDLQTSHVLPALIRKLHLAKLTQEKDTAALAKDFRAHGALAAEVSTFGIHGDAVQLWGSGNVYREFLHVDDLAGACLFLMQNYDYDSIGELINIGSGNDLTIRELAELIKDIVGFAGTITWDTTQPDGTPRKLLDVSRMEKCGWKATTSLREGIEKTYAAYCAALDA